MALGKNYELLVDGVEADFTSAVEALGSTEAVLSQASGEEQDIFCRIDLSKEEFCEKMRRASKQYPSLMFKFVGEFSEDSGDYSRKFWMNGQEADVMYPLAM